MSEAYNQSIYNLDNEKCVIDWVLLINKAIIND